MSDEKPAEKLTERLRKDEIQRQLLDKVLAGVEATRAEVANVRVDVAEVKTDVAEVKKDVTILGENHKDLSQRATITDRRLTEFEEWRARTSERVKDESQTRSKFDLEHQAQLVNFKESVTAEFKKLTDAQTLAMQNSFVSLAKDAAKTPMGQKLLLAGGGLLLSCIGLAAIYISLQTQRLQAQAVPPQPVAVPVYIQMPVDGGAR